MKVCNYYITFDCNDTCEFCGMWQRQDKCEEVPLETIREKLKELKRQEVKKIVITGGEPLLSENLAEILKIAKGFNFEIDLYTNGIQYLEKAQSIKGLVNNLFFSVDYPIPEEHDRSRGTECFDDVLKGIKRAKEYGENTAISFVVTRDSVRFLPEMVELAERLKVFINIVPVYDFFGTQGFDKGTISNILYYSKRKNVITNLALFKFIESGGNKVIMPRCRANETTVTMLPNGELVSPCFYNQGGKQGREAACSSCMRWPYMLPSFSIGIDKYFWLNLYSEWINKRKREEKL